MIIKYSEETKRKVVEEILSGELLVEEVILKYEIVSKRTVVRWLKQYRVEAEKNSSSYKKGS